jgi:tRNA modification GTPase
MTHHTSNDTIVARASPPGRGGVGVVRVSGPAVREIAAAMCSGLPGPRVATLRRFRDADGGVLDIGLALFFPAPHSYTGEDTLELQGHGGVVVIDTLVRRAIELGARPARPGEFSERAFLNDRMDLAQAEAVADLIDSGSSRAARAALRSLQGEFSAAVHDVTGALTELRMYVEAAIDFPEEEIDFLDDDRLRRRIDDVRQRFDDIMRRAAQGRLLADGLVVVLAGRPNAGKSSLLNRLCGEDAAIVTDIPGTTRDLVNATISLSGLPVQLVDTAGLRDTADPVEQEGVRRTRAAIGRADHALLIVDGSDADWPDVAAALADELTPGLPATIVINKIDLCGGALAPGVGAEDIGGRMLPVLRLSALAGDGMDALRQYLCDAAGYDTGAEGSFSARRRHIVSLEAARAAFDAGVRRLEAERAGELFAEELRLAQQALGEITGEVTSDDLLGRIFGSFCIGK